MLSQPEIAAQLLGWRGVLFLFQWANGKSVVLETTDRDTGLPSLDVLEMRNGRLHMMRSLAHVSPTFEIEVAGTLVDPGDRTDDLAFVAKFKDLKTALRVYYQSRGQRTESGTLIMPELPEEGWYDNSDQLRKD